MGKDTQNTIVNTIGWVVFILDVILYVGMYLMCNDIINVQNF